MKRKHLRKSETQVLLERCGVLQKHSKIDLVKYFKQLFWNVVKHNCSNISKKICVKEITLTQVYNLQSGKLVKVASITDISLWIF